MRGNQNKQNGLDSKLQLRIPPEMLARLDHAVEVYSTPNTTVTRSDLVRIALDKFLSALPERDRT